ncbi:MAG: polyprenyl diphosphate synthase [Pseudomonadota bacterium]
MPLHVAIIMDGNGRWAKRRGMPRHLGHRAGVNPVREAVRFAAENGVEVLTLFAFSSENWRRPKDEVGRLMALFLEALDREVDELHENRVRLRFAGALERLSASLRRRMRAASELTAANDGLNLNVAVAYGGRWDVLNAVRQALAAGVDLAALDEDRLSQYLQLADCPDPDLLIRTGGEQRISNFLLWQLAYSELYFTDVLWPDFDRDTFRRALEAFAARQRRRGRTDEQLRSAEC